MTLHNEQVTAKQSEAHSCFPARVRALVMDFDGVLTDNRVLVDQNGVESVFCHRGDGMGLQMLRASGVLLLVISKERNPVVQARCKKLQIECLDAIDDKLPALTRHCANEGMTLADVVYVGNDVNDLECLKAAGCGVAVADAHPRAHAAANFSLLTAGGHGAVRELCELIIGHQA